jgi:hypothetical protein
MSNMSIYRSKGLLGTLGTILRGSMSAVLIKAYLTFEVKNIETKVYRLSKKGIQSWVFGDFEVGSLVFLLVFYRGKFVTAWRRGQRLPQSHFTIANS